MSSVIPFIIWLFCVGVAALLIGKAIESNYSEPVLASPSPSPSQTGGKKEGFIYGGNSNSGSGVVLTTCPNGTQSYITESGNTYCCDGDIVNGQCNGRNTCSLSPNPPDKGLETCSGWLIKEWKRRSERFCTRDMPYYFGQMNRGPGIKEGCSASQPTSDGTQPFIPTDPQCKIYNTKAEEMANIDSCYNVQAMENLVCPQANATKSRVLYPIPGKDMPAILKCNYMPSSGKSNGMPVDCMDVDSIMAYLDAREPGNNYRNDPNFQGWINTCVALSCKASKAYYVDGTLTSPEAQCVNTMDSGGSLGAKCPEVKCPEPTCPSTPTPYDNKKRYRKGDMVILNGKTYKMVEEAGSPGYSPERAGDRLWSLEGGNSPSKDDTNKCFQNGTKLGKMCPDDAPCKGSLMYTKDECDIMGGTFLGGGGWPCLRPGRTLDNLKAESSKITDTTDPAYNALMNKYLYNHFCAKA